MKKQEVFECKYIDILSFKINYKVDMILFFCSNVCYLSLCSQTTTRYCVLQEIILKDIYGLFCHKNFHLAFYAKFYKTI